MTCWRDLCGLGDNEFLAELTSPGKRSFPKNAIKAAKEQERSEQALPLLYSVHLHSCSFVFRAWQALPLKFAEPTGSFDDLAAVHRQPPVRVHVDMAKGLELASMKTLPNSFCPDGTLVDSLASEAAALTRNFGVAKPFVHVEMRKWLPFWAVTEPDAGRMILPFYLWHRDCGDVCAFRFWRRRASF